MSSRSATHGCWAMGDEYTWWRVLSRSVRQVSEEFYEVKVEMVRADPTECLSVVQLQSTTEANDVDMTITDPAPGDLMVALVGYRALTDDDPPLSHDEGVAVGGSEYTVAVKAAGNGDSMQISTRIATEDDTTDFHVNGSGTARPVAAVLELRNGAVGGTWSAEGIADTSTTMAITGITVPSAGLLIAGLNLHNNSEGVATIPDGWVPIWTGPREGGLDFVYIGYLEIPAAGTYDLTFVDHGTWFDAWWQMAAIFVSGELCE